MGKRVIAMILALTMLAGILPAGAMAQGTQASVETDDLVVSGNNSFGTLLSERISEHQAEEEASAEGYLPGYSINSLSVKGSTARVGYDAAGPALLVVALYSEDGLQLLTSASAEVSADATVAELTFAGEMPDYFLASAYLLDTFGFSPLCGTFETPLYTEKLQKLRASTAADYDKDLVWQLTEDTSTNFGVFSDDVVRVKSTETGNTIVSVDDENRVYVIGNASLTVKYLSQGDILACEQANGDMLIVKVASLTKDGDTVTITGTDVALTEVFDYLKLEDTADTSDVSFPDEEETASSTYSLRDEYQAEGGEGSIPLTFNIGKPENEDDEDDKDDKDDSTQESTPDSGSSDSDSSDSGSSDGGSSDGGSSDSGSSDGGNSDGGSSDGGNSDGGSSDGGNSDGSQIEGEQEEHQVFSLEISGEVEIVLDVGLFYYIAETLDYLEFYMHTNTTATLAVEGTLAPKPLPLVKDLLMIDFFYGVISVGFKPTLKVELSASVEVSVEIDSTLGFIYSDQCGLQNTSVNPTVDFKVQVSGSFKVVVDWGLQGQILKGVAIKLEFPMETGVAVEAELHDKRFEDDKGPMPEEIHECNLCVSLELVPVFSLGVELSTLNEMLTLPFTIVELDDIVLGEAYYCIDKNECGLGPCPYTKYLITVCVQDCDEKNIDNTMVAYTWHKEASDESYAMGATNEYGTITDYVYGGTYTFMATVGKSMPTVTQKIQEAGKIMLVEPEGGAEASEEVYNILTALESNRVLDQGQVSTGGSKTIEWVLYGTGKLHIWGTGELYIDLPTKYEERVTSIQIDEGITSLKENVFRKYTDVMEVSIPESVTAIGASAFSGCESLHTINSVDQITELGSSVFYGCKSLRNILSMPNITSLPYGIYYGCEGLTSVIIPDYITEIGDSAFRNCTGLVAVAVPAMTAIPNYCFEGCTALTDVYLSEGLASIGYCAFQNCESLQSITLPSTVQTLGDLVFDHCKKLTLVRLSDSLTSIGSGAFQWCDSLVSIQIPEGVTDMGEYVLNQCHALERVILPTTLKTLGDTAFGNDTALVSVNLPDGLSYLGRSAFLNCSSLASIYLPDSLTAIEPDTFHGCSKLNHIQIPKTVTRIGHDAFEWCTSLTSIVIPEGVTVLEGGTFSGCTSLTSVTIPNTVTKIADGLVLPSGTFQWCESLVSIEIPGSVKKIGSNAFFSCENLSNVILHEGLEEIGGSAFEHCESLAWIGLPDGLKTIGGAAFYSSGLKAITIPASVTKIGDSCFAMSLLKTISFLGDAPELSAYIFQLVDFPLTAYYPAGNPTWTADKFISHGEMSDGSGPRVRWIPVGGSAAAEVMEAPAVEATEPLAAEVTEAPVAPASDTQGENEGTNTGTSETMGTQEAMMPQSVFGGQYTTDITDRGTEKTATFTGLVPGAAYTLLALAQVDPQDPLNPENLLYIDQAVAAEDGTLVFHYIQRVTTDTSYVMVFGAPYPSIADAQVTFPVLTPSEEPQAVQVEVTHNGQTLVEHRDYILTGTVVFTGAGQYTCTIRGINGYRGALACTYTVADHTHSFGDWILTTPPTVEAEGEETRKCLTCGFPETRPVDRLTEDPGQPGDPTDPSQPEETKPTEPTTPDKPEDTQPTEPSTPNEPGDTQPSDPRNPFVDVKEGKYYYDAVLWAVEEGITTGKTATIFAPNDPCTRKQIVTFLWRANGCPEPESMVNPFTDVKHDRFEKAILWAYYAGITTGKTATTFQPDAPCTRAQIVTFLWRSMGKPTPENTDNPFTDVPGGKYYTDAVLWALENGITTGKTATTFLPNDTCTRCQIVTFLYRALVD